MQAMRIFKENIEKYSQDLQNLELRFRSWSYFRLIVAIVLIAGIIYLANSRELWLLTSLVLATPIVFGLMIRHHNKIRFKREKARHLLKINEDEIKRSQLKLDEFDQGEDFADISHSYSSDLDVFGHHSVFQLVNRTASPMGRRRMAELLTEGVNYNEITERQEAAGELSRDLDWIQEYQALGRITGDQGEHLTELLKWLEEDEGQARKVSWWLIVPGIIAILSMLTLVISGYISFGWLLFPISYNVLLLSRIFNRMKDLMESTFKGNKAIKGYALLIELIENKSFSNAKLNGIQKSFHSETFSASKAVHQLNRWLDFLNSRANQLYIFIDILFLADFIILNRLSNWKSLYGATIKNWFSELAEMEALISVSSFSIVHPEYNYPSLAESDYAFSASDLGHPLIAADVRVSNDVVLSGKGKVVVITGSNMSGKSTFLRTVGVNLCLAQMGAPVSAKEMTFSPVKVYTSMRNSDLLEENISSFYAELKRIKGLLDSVHNTEIPIMYMIDEVLKGTNSTDRHIGSISLIRQLSKLKCFGWVSTHDLTLGELAEKQEGYEAMSFNSYLERDELIFDYKLTEGLCKSFNASILMKKMGIDIDDNE